MKEHNLNRHRKRHIRRQDNIDGFISPERFKQPSGSIKFTNNPTDQELSTSLGNFKRPDGYYSANPLLGGEEAETSAPVLPSGPRHRSTIRPETPTNIPTKKRRNLTKWIHRPKSWKKFFKRLALSLMTLLIIIIGFLAYKFYITERHLLKGGGQAPTVCDGNVPVDQLKMEGDGRVNTLLLGVGGPGHDGPDLTDTILLVSVDTINNKADLVSIPRDFWVRIPGQGYSKINQAYFDGKVASKAKKLIDREKNGLKLLDQTLQPILGLPIHYHVVADFKAFRQSVNALGGVTVKVPEQLYDPSIAWENNWNPIIAAKGKQHFNGAQALLYARSRETSSDFARSERQRQLLVAIKDKTLSAGTFSNPLKISEILDSLGNNVYSDYDLNSIKCLYKQVSKIPSDRIKSLDFVTPPNDLMTTGIINLSTGAIGGCAPGPSCPSIDYPKEGLYNYNKMRSFIRTSLKDGFIAKENASITILNGTSTAGLANQEKAILKSYGYRIGKIGDAPSHAYKKTILVDLRNGLNKYTRHYLERRLGVTATTKLPDGSIKTGTADFVIILGTDAINNS